MQNKISVGLATVLLGAMLLPAAWAQDAAQAGGPPPPPQGMRGRGPGNPDRETRRLTRELNLTSDQQPQVRQILEQRDAQMAQLHANTAVAGPQKHEQMRAIFADSDSKIRAVLTEEQKPKFDAVRARQMEQHEGRMGGGAPPPADGAQPGPPPQQ